MARHLLRHRRRDAALPHPALRGPHWTDDASLVESLKEPALRALEWIDKRGDLDGDGFVEYLKRSRRGLDNQSWKDSHDSQRFSDGRTAEPPIAACEVRATSTTRSVRAAELAREVWRDRALAERLEREAEELRERFNEAFWTDERGGYYVLALDGEKNQVDSLCSNVGHLLWSGIVPNERVDAVVDQMMGDSLWSGWGIRTMSTLDRAYNPPRVPQRHGLAPRQLALRVGAGAIRPLAGGAPDRPPDADRGAALRLSAPGGVRGAAEDRDAFSDRLSDCRAPQAWAAGTPVLLLQLLLGLSPDRKQNTLVRWRRQSCRRGLDPSDCPA